MDRDRRSVQVAGTGNPSGQAGRHTDLVTEDDSHTSAILAALQAPERLWAADEVLQRPSPLPREPGIYGWHFTTPPANDLHAFQLLYVGIAPRHISTRTSRQNLRTRVRYHYRGNAYGSTLRLTLGCLLGIELRRVGSGTRMTFGTDGEQALTRWMADHARVCWYPTAEPWLIEHDAIRRLDLPLNLDQNRAHPNHPRLSSLRAGARTRARELPVLQR